MSAPCPVLGFVVTAALQEVPDKDIDAMTADLADTLEANGLAMSRGGDRVLEYVVSREAAQATDADRQVVATWAARWTRTATITVSDLVDLNSAA